MGATYIPAANATEIVLGKGQGPPGYEGFGLHLPAINGHLTTGGLSVREVEMLVSEKMGTMDRFDAWMDFNVALYTMDIDYYLRRLRADSIRFLPARWRTPGDGKLMYSVFVHVPTSQMILELMSRSSDILPQMEPLLELEQRLSASRLQRLHESPPEPRILLPVRVSRSASDLSALDSFYVKAMRTNMTLEMDTRDVATRCYLWPGGNVDLCFTRRPENATTGSLKVKDFETMLKRVASIVQTKPTCSMNRWADNHYALDLFGPHGPWDPSGSPNFDYIVDYLEQNPSVQYQCASFGVTGLHYIYDPTGWAVQLNMRFGRQPRGCTEASGAPGAPGGSPMCSGGAC